MDHPQGPGRRLGAHSGTPPRSQRSPSESDLDLLCHTGEPHVPHETDLHDLREPLPLFICGRIKTGNVGEGIGHPLETVLAGEDQLQRRPAGTCPKSRNQEINVGIPYIPDPVHELDLGSEIVQIASTEGLAVQE